MVQSKNNVKLCVRRARSLVEEVNSKSNARVSESGDHDGAGVIGVRHLSAPLILC